LPELTKLDAVRWLGRSLPLRQFFLTNFGIAA
jgi:hypothetical protein